MIKRAKKYRPRAPGDALLKTAPEERLLGLKFNLLTVISFSHRAGSRQRLYWKCVCECGKERVVESSNLSGGAVKSCGCLHAIAVEQKIKKHGMTRSREYNIWSSIKGRCFNENNESFSQYGARGITMCEEWKNSFEKFFEHMGPVGSFVSIDRINNSGNYEPDNCRWSTYTEQANNTRRNIFITVQGITDTLPNFCRKFSISQSIVRKRIKRGWPVEDLFLCALPNGQYKNNILRRGRHAKKEK